MDLTALQQFHLRHHQNNYYADVSRPDLREPFYVYLVWSGCDLGGHSMFWFLGLCISMFWPGMVLNQGQLSIVVSDWESYLGSLFPCCDCGKLSLLGIL